MLVYMTSTPSTPTSSLTARDVAERLSGQIRNSSPRREYFRISRREAEALIAELLNQSETKIA